MDKYTVSIVSILNEYINCLDTSADLVSCWVTLSLFWILDLRTGGFICFLKTLTKWEAGSGTDSLPKMELPLVYVN